MVWEVSQPFLLAYIPLFCAIREVFGWRDIPIHGAFCFNFCIDDICDD